jgi:hypothetical protein
MEQDAKVTDDNILSLYCILQRCSIQEIYSSNRKPQKKEEEDLYSLLIQNKTDTLNNTDLKAVED